MAEVKAGWKTSEFWQTTAVEIIALATALKSGDALTTIIALVVAIVPVIGYVMSRTKVKSVLPNS